jgi:hypothetical protein
MPYPAADSCPSQPPPTAARASANCCAGLRQLLRAPLSRPFSAPVPGSDRLLARCFESGACPAVTGSASSRAPSAAFRSRFGAGRLRCPPAVPAPGRCPRGCGSLWSCTHGLAVTSQDSAHGIGDLRSVRCVPGSACHGPTCHESTCHGLAGRWAGHRSAVAPQDSRYRSPREPVESPAGTSLFIGRLHRSPLLAGRRCSARFESAIVLAVRCRRRSGRVAAHSGAHCMRCSAACR